MNNNSEISLYIDLIMYFYNTSDILYIYQKIKQEFGISITIHQISDYLDINRREDYEIESLKHYQNCVL